MPEDGDLWDYLREWIEEVCTRDPENPFTQATITALYCDDCWEKIQEVVNENN